MSGSGCFYLGFPILVSDPGLGSRSQILVSGFALRSWSRDLVLELSVPFFLVLVLAWGPRDDGVARGDCPNGCPGGCPGGCARVRPCGLKHDQSSMQERPKTRFLGGPSIGPPFPCCTSTGARPFSLSAPFRCLPLLFPLTMAIAIKKPSGHRKMPPKTNISMY